MDIPQLQLVKRGESWAHDGAWPDMAELADAHMQEVMQGLNLRTFTRFYDGHVVGPPLQPGLVLHIALESGDAYYRVLKTLGESALMERVYDTEGLRTLEADLAEETAKLHSLEALRRAEAAELEAK